MLETSNNTMFVSSHPECVYKCIWPKRQCVYLTQLMYYVCASVRGYGHNCTFVSQLRLTKHYPIKVLHCGGPRGTTEPRLALVSSFVSWHACVHTASTSASHKVNCGTMLRMPVGNSPHFAETTTTNSCSSTGGSGRAMRPSTRPDRLRWR